MIASLQLAMPAHTRAADPAGPNVPALCTAPWGVDLCLVTGVTTAFLPPDTGAAVPVPAGTWWTPVIGWATNASGGLPGFPLTYRADYVTSFPDDPMQDLASKLVKLTVIVDPGTRTERRFEFRPADHARLMTIAEFWGSGVLAPPELDDAPWIAYVPQVHPLSIGEHEIHLVYTLSAESCDGVPSLFGEELSVDGGHCLPEGDFALMPAWHQLVVGFEPRK